MASYRCTTQCSTTQGEERGGLHLRLPSLCNVYCLCRYGHGSLQWAGIWLDGVADPIPGPAPLLGAGKGVAT